MRVFVVGRGEGEATELARLCVAAGQEPTIDAREAGAVICGDPVTARWFHRYTRLLVLDREGLRAQALACLRR